MIEHLSYSSISLYLDCQRAWKHKYIDGIEKPKSASLVFGSAVHKALEYYLAGKQSITDAWPIGWKMAQDANTNWGNDTPETLYNYGLRMFTNDDVRQTIQGLTPLTLNNKPALETRFSINVPGVPVPIIGFIDMINEDGTAIDFKTSSKSWHKSRADNSLQATFYIAAMHQMQLTPLPAKFQYIIFVKNKTPKVQVFETERTAQDVLALYGLIADAWRSMSSRHFLANPETWRCSPKYCPAWDICMGGKIPDVR